MTLGPVSPAEPFLEGELALSGPPTVVTLTSATAVEVAETESGFTVSTLEGNIQASTVIDARSYEVPHAPTTDYSFSDQPIVRCDGVEYTPPGAPCLATGTALAFAPSYLTLARGAGVGLYANHWFYRDSAGPPYIAWHQIATTVQDACASGRQLRPALLEVNTTSAQSLVDPASGQSVWRIQRDASGQWNTHTNSTGPSSTQFSWAVGNSLTNTAQVSSFVDLMPSQPSDDGLGPASAGLTWRADGSAIRNTDERIIVGVGYFPRSGNPNLIHMSATETWKLELSYAPC